MIEKVAFTSNTGISTDIKPQNISDKKPSLKQEMELLNLINQFFYKHQ